VNTFYDYLYWRGDLTIEQSPLNEIDSMIFSILAYVNFTPVLNEFNIIDQITMNDTLTKFTELGLFENTDGLSDFDKECLTILKLVSSKRRYSKIKLIGYKEYFKIEKETQFGAISFILEDDSLLLSFRGTDESIIGWKEDFTMSFSNKIGSQKHGLDYLNEIAKINNNSIYITGHSKGGNVAVYSSVKSDQKIQERIVRIFNFDGPGFNKNAVTKDEYLNLGVDKIVTLVPQSSIVGILLQHEEPFSVVYSSKKTGIFQHYPMTWEVETTGFKRLDGVNNGTQFFDKTMHTFLEGLSEDDLLLFVDTLFNTVQAGGAVTLRDLFKSPAKTLSAIHKFNSETPSETKKQVETMIKAFFKISREVTKKESIKQFQATKAKTVNKLKESLEFPLDGFV
jgi:hypothetical protein